MDTRSAAKPVPHSAGDNDLLVDRTPGGDTLAFEELVRPHEGRVYRTVLGVTGNAEDADYCLGQAQHETWPRDLP